MDTKSILRNSWKFVGLLRVAGVQTGALFFAGYAAGLAAMAYGVRDCPPRSDYNNWYLWLNVIIAVVLVSIVFYYILRPSVWMLKINKHLAMNPTDLNLPFFSTHPSYVFIDAVFFIPAIAFLQSGRAETLCLLNLQWALGWAIFILAVSIPVMRVVSWYVFKRKIHAMKTSVPREVLIVWWIVAIPLFGFFTYSYMNSEVFPKLRVPVVNQKTFKGGLDENPGFQNQIVRVQGIMVREIAECGLFGKDPNEFPYPSGTIVLDMGEGNGEVIVQAKNSSDVRDLKVEASGRMERVVEAFGVLSRLPNINKKLVCGIGKTNMNQEGGVSLLEIELP